MNYSCIQFISWYDEFKSFNLIKLMLIVKVINQTLHHNFIYKCNFPSYYIIDYMAAYKILKSKSDLVDFMWSKHIACRTVLTLIAIKFYVLLT